MEKTSSRLSAEQWSAFIIVEGRYQCAVYLRSSVRRLLDIYGEPDATWTDGPEREAEGLYPTAGGQAWLSRRTSTALT